MPTNTEFPKSDDPLADRWRHAVAEQLSRGQSPRGIVSGLQLHGLSSAEAQRIVDAVVARRASPQVSASIEMVGCARRAAIFVVLAIALSVVTLFEEGFSRGLLRILFEAIALFFFVLLPAGVAYLMNREDPPETSRE